MENCEAKIGLEDNIALLFKACTRPLRTSPRNVGRHICSQSWVFLYTQEIISCALFEFPATAQWHSHCLKENFKNGKNLKMVKVSNLPHCSKFGGR